MQLYISSEEIKCDADEHRELVWDNSSSSSGIQSERQMLCEAEHWVPVMLQKWEEMLREGFMELGDVREQRGPNHIVWIDRKKNIMKLSQVCHLKPNPRDINSLQL